MLLFDLRFGLVLNAPAVVLALAAPFLVARGSFLKGRESWLMLAIGLAFLVFFSSVHYTRLQYITGIRYIVPVIPTNEGVGREGDGGIAGQGFAGPGLRQGLRKLKTKRQPAGDQQEIPAAQVDDVVHARSFAARLIAARIRG
jgi:hypothetical protein